jgi:NAD(P)-dependent dehydrogenase (short-subunit alcohol dehydrogenase family)
VKLERGQVAVVTGGACGIGRALAEGFVDAGLKVVVSDIHEPSLTEAQKDISAKGGEVVAVPADVGSLEDVQRLATATLDRFGRVDIICNNAGTVGKNLPLWEFEMVEWEWLLRVNLWGVIHGIRAFVPYLVDQGTGHVVNVASMAGISTVSFNGPYNVSKHAVVAISETLAADCELRAPKVGVTVVCPGPTSTRLAKEGPRPRPARFTPERDVGILPKDNPGTFRHSSATLSTPEEVAAATVRAIEHDRLYVIEHPGSRPRIEKRINGLLSDLQWCAEQWRAE